MSNPKKILVELSGGLDSSVAAMLIQKQGFDVVGVMMHLHEGEAFDSDLKVAQSVAKQLKIDFHVVDFRDKFNDDVVRYFIDTYKDAKTPNPCIVCNRRMKFGAIFDVARNLDCEFIATGHYARVKHENGVYSLYKAKNLTKDQSYVLHFLDQDKLSKILFPLGDYKKDEVRELARDSALPCVDKEESMDICFVEDEAYSDFIQNNSDYVPAPGNVVDTKGNVIGQHNGLINYTIGQRKGLGISAGNPQYVIRLDKKNNEVVLGSKNETLSKKVCVCDFSWVAGSAPSRKFKCQAKLRYRQSPRDCEAFAKGDKVTLYYKDGIDAVTPGQFAVLYDGEKVLGGGTIEEKCIPRQPAK